MCNTNKTLPEVTTSQINDTSWEAAKLYSFNYSGNYTIVFQKNKSSFSVDLVQLSAGNVKQNQHITSAFHVLLSAKIYATFGLLTYKYHLNILIYKIWLPLHNQQFNKLKLNVPFMKTSLLKGSRFTSCFVWVKYWNNWKDE